MSKPKRKLTSAEKRAKKKRREETMIIFINGKQKRVKRPPTINGLSVDEFISRNADPIWLHQNEMWDAIKTEPGYLENDDAQPKSSSATSNELIIPEDDIDIPF